MCTYLQIYAINQHAKNQIIAVTRTFKFPFVVKAFWQTLQTNGRSPVWVRMWIWTAELELKFLWQTRHKCFKFVDCGSSFDGLWDDEAVIDDSSKYDVLFDWVGEDGGNDVGKLFSNDLEWNKELGMESDNGIVDFNCEEPGSLNYVKSFILYNPLMLKD